MTLQQLRLSKQTKSFEGTADSAVASDTRGQGFESSRLQFLLNNYLLLTVCRKDENKENRVWQWTILTHKGVRSRGGNGFASRRQSYIAQGYTVTSQSENKLFLRGAHIKANLNLRQKFSFIAHWHLITPSHSESG